jgi:hypothetical protein
MARDAGFPQIYLRDTIRRMAAQRPVRFKKVNGGRKSTRLFVYLPFRDRQPP